jgi:phenylalanyl-tRNA synthetase beta chain
MSAFSDLFKKLFGNKPKQTFAGDPLIVAAKVLSVEKHPNADRLRIIKLDIGDKVIDPVVCGAFNFGVGDTVVLALPGAMIAKNIHSEGHKPFKLEKAKIRGTESQGMICAAFELGIGELSEKPEILLLKPDTTPGSQFSPEMIQ